MGQRGTTLHPQGFPRAPSGWAAAYRRPGGVGGVLPVSQQDLARGEGGELSLSKKGAGPGRAQREGAGQALTWGLEVLAELRLGLAIGPEVALWRELIGHGGGGDDGFEAALALGYVLLRVEEDDVDLGHVEHPQGH